MKHPEIGTVGLIRPHWSLGGKKSNRHYYSTNDLESALLNYKEYCVGITSRVTALLRAVTERLSCSTLIQACRLAICAQSLIQHSWEAHDRHWCMPVLSEAAKSLSIRGFWPYWMEGNHEKTVTNSLELKDMVLLTGPNMAGKSTVLRSVAAVSMLALAGLYAPAEAVQCPLLDYIVLRSFSGDSPFDQHSGFSMEMAEMQLAVEQCTDRSLILIDELGKGTEVKTGGGLAGSLLEYFASKKCIGIFSTHLHLVKKMPLKMNDISLMKMNTNVIEADEKDDLEMPLEKIYAPEWTVTSGKPYWMSCAREMGGIQDTMHAVCLCKWPGNVVCHRPLWHELIDTKTKSIEASRAVIQQRRQTSRQFRSLHP